MKLLPGFGASVGYVHGLVNCDFTKKGKANWIVSQNVGPNGIILFAINS